MPSFNSILRAFASLGHDLGNSYAYDPNPNSFDCPPDSYHPSHPTYKTSSYDSYGNDSQFGYDYQPQFPLNYESEPGYIENYNSHPYDSSSLPQQYPCCTRCEGPRETCQCDQLIFDEPYCKHCGGPHMNFQCQPMNQNAYNSNSLSFDQPQPPHNLEYRDEIKIAELKENFNGMSIEIRKKEKLQQLEQWAYLITHPSKRLHSFCYDDDDEDYTFAIIPNEPVLSTEEPDISLSMGDEHLDTIPATKSDKVIKSSVENLIPIPKETNTFDNSLPEFETFCFGVEEISSGSTTTHSDISLPEYEAFYDDHVKEVSSGSSTTHSDSLLYASFIFDLSINPFPLADRIAPQYLLSLRNEDTIFDPGICNSYFSRPDVFHQCGTIKKFNTHRSHLNECPMLINEKNTPILDVPLFHFYPP
nr:hypothetical protein [Tanacetum cinerariifolium]